ncbi:MAG: serine hydrolase domain-containing protein [Candidatus Acidiferrales bacterium]
MAARAQMESHLPPEARSKIDQIVGQSMEMARTPSVSIAIVKEGEIAYLRAYGDARFEPRTAAAPSMRYSIGSISKQFTATAMLMLVEEGKLSLEDSVSRFLPSLTRAKEITIRQLLSHTSGYQDYWPQDYVFPDMLKPVTAQEIMERWARKPLDFEPGTRWQYSNTGFVIAGAIIEKASGEPLVQFLRERIFSPLGMRSVLNVDGERLSDSDPTGYLRYALGPFRVAPREGTGWLFAAGELAMSAEDLAKWDIAMIGQKLLKPDSYRVMQTETLLKNGLGTNYGLGIGVRAESGHRVLEHGGGVSGFTTENVIFPDDRAAVVVLTNQDAFGSVANIARKISAILFAGDEALKSRKEQEARKIFESLQHGTIDRNLFTANGNSYFNDEAIQDFQGSLGPLGPPQLFSQVEDNLRGGMEFRAFRVQFPSRTLVVTEREMPDGKIEQYQVEIQE